ncbi:hypothetical protein NDU88_000961 [Pleurodeles waltl]|uniref:Uncharacterized protein n=1 Tax=Pleurodeles waltl TaxID=8319 RepID=A0AAV7V905_PLEWA|nr:hypothetical protein NDU88_000961 [Pleurodeles waltl]
MSQPTKPHKMSLKIRLLKGRCIPDIIHKRPEEAQATQPTCVIEVAASPVKALTDTETSINALGLQYYMHPRPRPALTPSATKLFTYGSNTPLPLKGRMTVTIRSNNREIQATFHVVSKEADTFLGSHSAEELGLVSFTKSVGTF